MGDWHPILAAMEIEPSHWQMIAQYGATYGRIRLVRFPDGPSYVGTSMYGFEAKFDTLRAATEAIHPAFVRSHSAGEWPGYPKQCFGNDLRGNRVERRLNAALQPIYDRGDIGRQATCCACTAPTVGFDHNPKI